MSLAKITAVAGRAVPVPGSDIDTDRIIPARFMKCVTFDDLGQYAFFDARFDESGNPKGHPLDDPRFQGASILLSGVNFGCGSSREHAPQSLYRFGFRGVIAESFAEIFFGNCTTLGIPCACASAADLATIMAAVEADPSLVVEIDVENRMVRYGDRSVPVSIPGSAHEALTEGRWDPIADLLANADAVG
jgi:3-isopropylmalate/(R)-2-methylmalate dehydratase small subunit